jgi:hypothetical protein
VHVIVREILRDAHQALAAFLRDSRDLPEPSDLMVELAAAFKDHADMMDIQYEEEIEGRGQADPLASVPSPSER